jgi:short-chain fatty acids transporter
METEEKNIQETTRTVANGFSRLAVRMADWAERWFPDAFVFALGAIVIVFLGALFVGERPGNATKYFGDGFWQLIPFTLQMAMVIVGGYVVASSPPVGRVIQGLARIPRTPRSAVALVAFLATTSSLLSWGFSLIFSSLLVRQIVKNVRGVDYRAASAAAYLGVCTVWALGLSSSAALMMATQGSIPPAIFSISGRIPLTHTIFAWQSLTTAGLLIISSVAVAYLSTPAASEAKSAKAVGTDCDLPAPEIDRTTRTPGEWLENNGLLTVLVCGLGFAYLVRLFFMQGPLVALDLNTYNFLFIMLGMLLHWEPRAFVRAVSAAVPATAGVLIQFPFYSGIFGIMTKSPLSSRMAEFFVGISSHGSYSVLLTIYSAILGLFVPSGGSKWIIEAPYVLAAAKQLQVNLGWIVQIYNTAEALPNLINPFWMLPLLGILNIRAREVIGYSSLYLIVNFPLVLFLMWFFARTLPYAPPGAF